MIVDGELIDNGTCVARFTVTAVLVSDINDVPDATDAVTVKAPATPIITEKVRVPDDKDAFAGSVALESDDAIAIV